MMFISLAAMIATGMLCLRLNRRLGHWNAAIVALLAYIVVMSGVALLLPDLNEVPEGFPATLLWHFRVVSLGGQAIMWATFGLLFGALAENMMASSAQIRVGR